MIDYSKGARGLSVQLYKNVSSRLFRFHRNSIRDSGAVVTPFMQDGTYPSRNFATLGPSGLRPPFTGVYKKCVNISILPCSTGQVSDFIHHFKIQQNLMFLLNSRYPLFFVTYSPSYPEVTKLICLVPLILLFLMPQFIKPINLCQC